MAMTYFLLLLLAAGCCYGDGERADHLLLLETLPEGVSLDRPTFLDVRTNFSGTVRVVESSEFRVVVNISAEDLQAAYRVQADLTSQDGGLLLQVSEQDTSAGIVTLTWLGLGIAGATFIVLVLTSLYACCWYRHERSLYDLAEKKSVAGSSQRGVYRSRNSLQVVNLPPIGDLPLVTSDREEGDGPHNDDSLKQVPEMPEEEEAEAIEMEELTLLKLKEMDAIDPTTNENDPHRLTPQERNLIKNQLHSQPKNVHKDLLRKDKGMKAHSKDRAPRPPAKRRTANGLYTGVASSPDTAATSADESLDSENDVDIDVTGDSIRGMMSSEPSYENTHKPMSTFMSPQRSARPGGGLTSTPLHDPPSRPVVKKLDDFLHPESERAESGLQVMADIHKSSTQPEIVKVATPDKQTPPAFASSLSPDTPRPTLTTFTSPAQAAPPTRSIRFKEPDQEAADRPAPPPYQSQPPPPPPPPQANSGKFSPAARFAPGFPIMGDIPEDPREDCDSVQSESGRSRSMYGSSEIFDANNPEHTYYNLEDSDIDIPPLDAEDFFSDGGLPSPRSASLGRGRAQDDCSLMGPRSVFFGRDSALTAASKPRPYSSIIPRTDHSRPSSDSGVSSGISSDQTSTPVNSEVDSTSPQLPPPPLPQEGLGQEGSAFSFPPPPRYFTVPHKSWSSSPTTPVSAGDYVTLPNNSTKAGANDMAPNNSNVSADSNRPGGGGGGGGGGGRLGYGSSFTHLTILSVTCLLALTTGVYGRLMSDNDETRVDITVFAPSSLLSARTNTIFFNLHRDTDLQVDGHFDVDAFVLSDPVLRESHPELCAQSRCQADQGCDVQTGQCICHKGYRMLVDKNGHQTCVDVNECAEGFTMCHPSAGCMNRKGSYDCVCSIDYYGDGKTCHDCSTPCRDDQYEVQACSKSQQKICKECTKVCPSGYYMASQCTESANAVCRVCQPLCLDGEYEYRTCSTFHDRQCKNVTLLPEVESSDNVILEEDRKVRESEVTIEHLPKLSVAYTRYSLKRGTGLEVDISVQNLEAAQRFVPLALHNSSTPASSPSVLRSAAVQRFCPSPVPDHYILHYTKHQGVTYQLDGEGEIKPCHTYTDHGTFPNQALNKDNSFLCREPGSLTKLFEIPPDIFHTSTHWAERSKRCAGHSAKCEQCTRRCAQQMVAGSSDCSIVGDNNDNGWSPRLQVCYNCCARSNCSTDCRSYHRRRCQPLKCHFGNLVEFSIFPSWSSSQNSKFFCHIQPVARQRLLETTYQVKREGTKETIYTGTITVDGGEDWQTQGHTVYRDKLLNVIIDSRLGQLPDFLEGRISTDTSDFHVGSYIKEGSRVESSVISGESIRVHPLKPFGVRINRADPQKCENDILKESVIAGEHQSPYRPNHDLRAVAFHNVSTPFIITRLHQPPTVTIAADRRSFLKAIFPAAIVKVDSLTGRMSQNSTHWTVEVMGSVQQCPGYLKVVLSDPAYRKTPLYSTDVAVTCPPTFHLHFHLPASDAQGLDRQVVASLEDARQVHHLRLHRPASSHLPLEGQQKPSPAAPSTVAPAPSQQTEVNKKVPLPQGFIFSIPYMVSVGGAVILLLCLLIIGLIVQPGVPAPEPPILRFHHTVFMVIYVVFQFLYSLIATSSVFFLVIIAVNSPRVAFIQQQQQQSVATSASHQLELTAMQTYLQRELHRQDEHMNSVRSVCRADMQLIVDDMKQMHSQVLRETEDVFQKHRLELLLEEHRHRSMQQLSQDLLSFRAKYDQAVRSMLLELNHNIQQAHQSIENNSWLAGARYLHGVVTSTRKHINNVDTKPFMEWAHLQSDLSKLIVDVSFSLPSLPKLAEIEEVMEAEAKPSRQSREEKNKETLHTTHVYNKWFSPFSHNATWEAMRLQGAQIRERRGREERSLSVFYIFMVILGCLDVVLALHRMLNAKVVGQLLLYGFPEYMDFRERKDEGDDDVFDNGKKCQCCSESPFCQAVKTFFSQLISSAFIPKAVMVVATALLLRGMLHVSSTMLTVKSLHKAGLYHSSEEYLDLHSQLINGRLQAHAHHINTVDFPAYQTWMSAYIQRHQFAFQVYQQQLRRMQKVHMSYCGYLQSLGLSANCSQNTPTDDAAETAHGVISPACQFQPVQAKFYKRSESVYRNLSEQQLDVMLENLRAIIFDTCQVIVVFLSIIVLKELLCAVVWIFIRRSGLIRLRIIYETDQDDPNPSG